MGCTCSKYSFGKKKKNHIPEVSVLVPCLRVPLVQSDIQRNLRGLIPKDVAHRIASLRNHIAFVAQDTRGSAVDELQKALESYLPLVLGLAKKEYGLQEQVEFRWKELNEGRHEEMCVANSWFELLSLLHMMAMLGLIDANLKLIPKENTLAERLVSTDCMRDVLDLLLKATGYLNFCIRDVLPRLPPDVRNKIPIDMQEKVLEAISHQALAQGTEVQLGLAVQSQNATLSVKRRLACEQLSFFVQAHCSLSEVDNNSKAAKKHLLFLKWKCLEAKAVAYYYHGLILDKGAEPSSHISAVCCFLAAEQILVESKKACLTFCLADPVTRAPPPWGVMKILHKKIPETASKKSQMYGYLIDQDKSLHILPDLPEFQLSLKPDDYELPQLDPAWDKNCGKWEIPGQPLKEHLNDGDDL